MNAAPDSPALWRSIFERATTGMAVVSAEGRLLHVNDALCTLLGYVAAELLQKTLQDILHPDADAALPQALPPSGEQRCISKSGATLWVRLDAGRLANGSSDCLLVSMHDIGESKRAEEALKKSQDRFNRMVEMGPFWYWEQDEQYRFVDLPGLEKHLEKPEALIGKTRWEAPGLAPLPDEVWRRHKAVLDRRESFSEFIFMRRNDAGELIYLSTSGEPAYDAQGNFTGYHGICRDITPRVRAQKAIEASDARYRKLFDLHPHPMWVVDSQTLAFLAVNEAAIRHYGYSREEFLAMTPEHIRPAADIPALLQAFTDTSQAYMRRLWRHKKKSGELIDVDIIGFNLEFDGRRARMGVITDVTERLKAEARARESEERYQELLKGRG